MDGLVQEYSCTRVQYSSTRVSISLIRSPVRYFDTGVLEYCTRVLISTQVLEYCTRVLEYQVLEYSSIWVDYRYVQLYYYIYYRYISIDIIIDIAIVLEYRYSTRVQYSSTRVPVSISSIRSPVRYFYRYTTIMTLFTRVLEYSSTGVL